jgi:hypothetical protein
MARSRPAQGNNSKPTKPARPAYASEAAPSVVSVGSVSRPSAPPKWRPKPQSAPRRVTNPQTVA